MSLVVDPGKLFNIYVVPELQLYVTVTHWTMGLMSDNIPAIVRHCAQRGFFDTTDYCFLDKLKSTLVTF